jgi:hypothetical protein
MDDKWLLEHAALSREALLEIKDIPMVEVASLYQSLQEATRKKLPSIEVALGRKWYTIIPDSKHQQYYFFDACTIRNVLAREDVDE